MPASRWLLICACLGVIACAPSEDRAFATQRDSAGILVAESIQPRWPDGREWTVDSLPLLDLGAAGIGPEHEFFRVRDATRLPDGRIAVANFGTNEVRLYGSDGRFLFSAGRGGQGPGEFERLTSVRPYRGDSLVAFDYWAKRLTLLDSSGAVARVTSLIGQDGSLSGLHAFSDGRFLLHTNVIGVMAHAQGRIRVPAPLLLLSPNGLVQDTLAVVAGFETYVFERGDAAPPFRHQAHVAVRDTLVYVGDGNDFEFRVLDQDGTLRQIVRVPGYDLVVSEEVRDSMKQEMLQRELPPFLRPSMEAMANSIPTRRPAYSGLVVDSGGNVWVAEYLSSTSISTLPRRWLVFDPSGIWLGDVDLPSNFDLFEVGQDYVLGRYRNALEVETIQVLRLTRS